MNQMFRTAKLWTLVFLASLAWPGEYVRAYTVTFNGIGGNNLDPYAGHSEGGFVVTPATGAWFKGHWHGKPIPSIFGIPDQGSVQVTNTATGLFTFSSVDLTSVTNANAMYSLEGFLSDSSVLISSGTLSIAESFITIPSPNPSTVLDRLKISITSNGATSYNIDNIVMHSVVPEPSTALLSMGLPLLIYVSRRRVC
jgi:hypothetical protein